MPLGNGLGFREELDTSMIRAKNEILQKADIIKECKKSICITEDSLNSLKEEGLVTPELEQTFTHAVQECLEKKEKAEKEIDEIMQKASQEIQRATEVCDKEIDGVKKIPGSHAAQVLSSLLQRKTEIEKWEEELQEAVNTKDE